MQRCDGWESLLNDHIEKHLNLPQKWGEIDCCLFPCNWILLACGVDPAKDFRGKYKTKLGADRAIKSFAGDLMGLLQTPSAEWLGYGQTGDDTDPEEIEKLLIERQDARKAKDFARADEIRATLDEMGIAIEDTPEGTKWRKVG